ncbi:hypothetical protein ABZ234_06635 [Nocardiopsis sp. NPDC006198]|uniref:pPIWI_RE_Y domain-containing protein n=1 Tax=Nocardiopsis sp. NPDC006198 TaxID=3154472 RepID=UPI0033A92A44
MTEAPSQEQKPTVLTDLVGGPYDEKACLEVLRSVARAVVDLAEHPRNSAFGPPYPPMAQHALDRICLLGAYRYPKVVLHHGSGPRYPRGLTELLAWCRDRPVSDWFFLELPEEFEEITDRLIETDPLRPSLLCLRLSLGVDPSTPHREVEKRVMRKVYDAYHRSGKEEGYLAFRRSIIDTPVMNSRDFALYMLDTIGGVHVQDLPMDHVYAAVPDKYFTSSGKAAACRYCGLLLAPTAKSWVCEINFCPSREQVTVGTSLHRDDGVLYHLIRPIREFVVAPVRIDDSKRASPHVPSPDRQL